MAYTYGVNGFGKKAELPTNNTVTATPKGRAKGLKAKQPSRRPATKSARVIINTRVKPHRYRPGTVALR